MRKLLEEYADWFSFPCLLAALLALAPPAPYSWLAFVGGFILWTLAEYIIHRWVLHGFYWMAIHQRHHEHPLELTRFPLWQIPFYFGVIGLACWLAFGQWWMVTMAGIVFGYIWFFTMHALEHHAQWLVPQLAINHNAHHKVTTCNYGITVTWWDRVFGTYREPRRKG